MLRLTTRKGKPPSKDDGISAWEFFHSTIPDILGCILYALGVYSFTAVNQIAPGGITGLSTLANHLFGVPIGITSFVMNIPLFIFGYVLLGKHLILRTMKTMVIFSVILDFVFVRLNVPVYRGDVLLAALFGGVLIGAGLAIIFMSGSTTGGTDIGSKLVRLKYPHMQLGRAILILDFFVLVLAAVVYNNIETALYGLITIFTSTRVIDAVLYGLDVGKMVYIVTSKSDEIAQQIISELKRGATIVQGRGAFSSQERDILFCAVRKSQFYPLKRIVHTIDPAAFLIVTEANEILGEGFKSIYKD